MPANGRRDLIRRLKFNSDISVIIVCNKTGGTIKGDIQKKMLDLTSSVHVPYISYFTRTVNF